jgi:hypothetical protein
VSEKTLGKVDYYTHGTVTLDVSFPEDKTVCQWCRFCRNEDSLRRWKCLLTDEYIVYPFHSVGNECPIIFKNKE